MTLNEIIEELENKHSARIEKGDEDYYYTVEIYDYTLGCMQTLDLTEDELVELYKQYFA